MVSFLREHFFSVIIITLLVLLATASFYRFVVINDYLVSFEGECDPYSESCYEACENDKCEKMYYYSIIERNAAETRQLCGTTNVLECDAAYECQPDVEICSITYCDPEIEGNDYCVTFKETS